MAEVVKRERQSPFAELFDWLEAGFPVMPSWRGVAGGAMTMRVEDYYDEAGRYVLRAELPGVDPDKDVEITVQEGVLGIRAERREERKDKNRSEFRYGSFVRSVTLPVGAQEDQISASYDNGILEVVVPIGEAAKEAKHVPVQRRPAK